MTYFPVEYSTLSAKELLNLVIDKYCLDIKSKVCFLKRGFNDTYLIETQKENYIFRVYKCNWRSIESIETELKLLDYLKENSVSVSFPIMDKQQKFIQAIQAPEGVRFAVLFSYAKGNQIRKLSVEQANLLGMETGRIHALTQNKSFGKTAHNYDIETQFTITINILKPVLVNYPEQYNYLVQLKNDFLKLFDKIDLNELSIGICHGDLQAENFHISDNNQFTFFDFDFFGNGYLAYDIGVFMWYDHKNKSQEIINSFLKGYQTQQKLSSREIELVPYFSVVRALFQMTLYCRISDGKQLPVWPASQVADFIKKVNSWVLKFCKPIL